MASQLQGKLLHINTGEVLSVYKRIFKKQPEYKDMEPSHIAKFVLHLSKTFNKYYANVKIVADDVEVASRLALVEATTIVLKEGLRMLGMEAPEEM